MDMIENCRLKGLTSANLNIRHVFMDYTPEDEREYYDVEDLLE